jgi:alpha-beta hydrolase superfamily lysophospholipase
MTHIPHRRRVWIALVASSVYACLNLIAQVPAPSLSGAWEGQMLLNGTWRFMEGQFGEGTGPTGAKVDLPQERREFRDFTSEGDRLKWNLARGQNSIRFDGVLSGDVIRGQAEQRGVLGEFQLVRIDRRASRPDAQLAATYRTRGGGLITVARYDFGDSVDRLGLLDAERGYWGTLLPTGADTYLFAPARSGRFPLNLRVVFERNAQGMGSLLTMTGAAEQVVAQRIDSYESREVTFQNGTVTLAGTIVSPRAAGLVPAVVMVHSSGNQSRNGPVAYFRLIANIFAANGIAALVYDKRGVGASTGAWTTASFHDLAGDATAAIAAVRRAPGIDAERVGFWSLSQGGWIAPLAAGDDKRIRFLSLMSAAATTPAQQEMDRVVQLMKANGFSDVEMEIAYRYLRTFFQVVAGEQSWNVLQAAVNRYENATWAQYVPRPRTAAEATWAPEPVTLDPATIFQKVSAPVLAIHGADDADIDAAKNSSLFAKMSTHPMSRQQVFESADHYLLVGVKNPDAEYRRLHADYLRLTIDWIKLVTEK